MREDGCPCRLGGGAGLVAHMGGDGELGAAAPLGPLGGGTLLAEGAFASGTTTFDIQKPQESNTIVLRVTQLPKNNVAGELAYKAAATEITLK